MKKKQQIDGKLEQTEPSSLAELWGSTGIEKYKTLDLSIYTTELANYNKSDLDEHAIKIGLIPVENRQLLTKRLLEAFRVHTGGYKRPKSKTTKGKLPGKEVMDILAEGR